MPDPVLDILKTAPIRDETKALVWDAYTQASDTDDLVKRLGPLPVPESIKADLWDLKRQSGHYRATPATEDRGNVVGSLAHGAEQRPVVGGVANLGELFHYIPGVSQAVDLAYGQPGFAAGVCRSRT